MPTSSTNPEPLDEFDRITATVPMLSPFRALWNEAEEMLLKAHPDGFEPEEIGRIAFGCLPEAEREAAMDELFYTYWTETVAYREARAAQAEAAGGAS